MATDIGIDLGSSKTVIFSSSKIVLEQPSAVTVDAETYEPKYFGEKAKQTLGRTPDTLECVMPIQNGLISDYDTAEAMLKNYMGSVFGNKIVRPRVMATIPAGLTELQHRSLSNAVTAGGGRNITVIETPLAVAFGLDIDISGPNGNMIIDMGAGATDIAVLSLGGIVVSDSFKTASNDFDLLIENYVKKKYNIAIGPLTAEDIKKRIGSVYERPVDITAVAKGRNLFNGLPESFEITSAEVYEAIKETAFSICEAVKRVLENTEPDLVADITENGIYLTGGGSQIVGMDKLLAEYIGIKINTAKDPAYTAVKGAAKALNDPGLMKNINYQLRSIKELSIT